MKQILAAATALNLVFAIPAVAQEDTGRSLMEEGARLLLEGLMQEMEPALEELQGLAEQLEPSLRGFLTEMGPALQDLLAEVEDWSAYHPPEIMPNGDIILRRKTDTETGGDVDL